MIQKSLNLKYDPSSEPVQISVNQLFKIGECCATGPKLGVLKRGVEPPQGYLAHKKPPLPRTLQQDHAQGLVGVPVGWAFSYERGTPAAIRFRTNQTCDSNHFSAGRLESESLARGYRDVEIDGLVVLGGLVVTTVTLPLPSEVGTCKSTRHM